MPEAPGQRPAGTLHLSARHRAMLEALLKEHLPEVEVWAYGSRVNGESHDGSDLDLVLRGPGLAKIDISRLVDFEEALRDSTVPFLVEAHDWARLPESFHRVIERRHVALTETKNEDKVSEWRECTWGELATLEYGRALRGYRSRKGPYRVFGTNGPIGWHTDALYNGPGVIVGRKGAYRGVHYAPSPFFVIDTAFYLKPKTQFDVRWAYYELLLHDIDSLDTGTAIPSLRRESFYDLPVRVPSLAEQREIAHILGAFDDKIDLNRRMSKTLVAMAWALFKSWFVDYEPVSAKQDSRDTGLPKEISDLFPDRLVDSSSGEIPEGWTTSEIGEEVDTFGGATPSTKEPSYWIEGEHHWATPKDLAALHSPILLETDRKITDAGVKRISSRILPAGTVLLSSRAPIGYLAIAEMPTAVNQGFIAMICNRRLPKIYVLFWCRANLDYIAAIAGGSTFAEISRKTFRTIPVIVPSAAVLAAYEEIVRPLYDRIVAHTRESASLTQTRDLLLPKLMSRTVPVPTSNRH